jgi:hypothetical protein
MYEFQIIASDGHPAKIRTEAEMLLRVGRFISIYLTARTLSLMLCALLAGWIVLRLSAKVTAAREVRAQRDVEEPRLFNATVVRELQSIGVRLAAAGGVQRK